MYMPEPLHGKKIELNWIFTPYRVGLDDLGRGKMS
jgi:hypothetical protein